MAASLIRLFVVFLLYFSAESSASLPQRLEHGLGSLTTSRKPSEGLIQAVREAWKLGNGATLCEACRVSVEQLIAFRRSGASAESVANFMKSFCYTLPGWVPAVCDGYVDNELDAILFIIDNRADLSGERACAIYFQPRGCTDAKASNWSIPLPPKIGYKKVSFIVENSTENEAGEKSSEKAMEIMQLTDFHYDPLYEPGADADCGLPLCCQKGNGAPANASNAAGHWGDYHVCDIPWHLVSNFTSYVNKAHKNIDLIYYTGDIIAHRSWDTNIEKNSAAIKKLFDFFKQEFNSTPIYPILGNHEPHPSDFYSPGDLSSNAKVTTQWLFDLVAEEWSKWLPESTKATIKRGGFYTVLVKPGFRIIALNSNVCFIYNLWLVYNDEDPYDQLKWLVQTLSKAEEDGEKVHILSHIPPGEPECLQQWTLQFRRIVNRFASTISAQFNGHTHRDELKLFSENKKITNVAFNAGSFTPFVGNNPNYRLYSIQPQNYRVDDYDHYIFNLTQANLTPERSPAWFKLYSFKSAYGVNSTADYYANWNDLVARMKTQKSLLEQFFRYQYRMSPIVEQGCDETCLKELLCQITSVEAVSSIQCQSVHRQ